MASDQPPTKRRRTDRKAAAAAAAAAASANSTTIEDNYGSHFICLDRVPTLLDLCAKVTAENVAFQTIEERYSSIPEPVQKRVLFWSFPREELHIRMYSSPSCEPGTSGLGRSAIVVDDPTGSSSSVSSSTTSASSSSYYEPSSPFTEGLRLLENGCVEDALQIGKLNSYSS